MPAGRRGCWYCCAEPLWVVCLRKGEGSVPGRVPLRASHLCRQPRAAVPNCALLRPLCRSSMSWEDQAAAMAEHSGVQWFAAGGSCMLALQVGLSAGRFCRSFLALPSQPPVRPTPRLAEKSLTLSAAAVHAYSVPTLRFFALAAPRLRTLEASPAPGPALPSSLGGARHPQRRSPSRQNCAICFLSFSALALTALPSHSTGCRRTYLWSMTHPCWPRWAWWRSASPRAARCVHRAAGRSAGRVVR